MSCFCNEVVSFNEYTYIYKVYMRGYSFGLTTPQMLSAARWEMRSILYHHHLLYVPHPPPPLFSLSTLNSSSTMSAIPAAAAAAVFLSNVPARFSLLIFLFSSLSRFFDLPLCPWRHYRRTPSCHQTTELLSYRVFLQFVCIYIQQGKKKKNEKKFGLRNRRNLNFGSKTEGILSCSADPLTSIRSTLNLYRKTILSLSEINSSCVYLHQFMFLLKF